MLRTKLRRYGRIMRKGLLLSVVLGILCTVVQVRVPSLAAATLGKDDGRFQVLDRNGEPLGVSYITPYNTLDHVPLHAMPPLLWHAFVAAEDRKFFSHHGVDWRARASAIWQNIRAAKKQRGASTITEQVVRILHPRPRTLWSRWLEGFEAPLLELRSSKGEILEFYLNQVPYAANRRGVAQAARYYFNRDLDTLTHKEMLALAVLPRAPSALDMYSHPARIEATIARLTDTLVEHHELSAEEANSIRSAPLTLEPPPPLRNASHFINYIRETVPYHVSDKGVLVTTLDGTLQQTVQQFLDERLRALARKNVHNGAVLVADHTTGEILAWVVGNAGTEKNATPGRDIDAVRSPRQPGSSMKPFLYALALDRGWSPATILQDVPMEETIGNGLHDFHNYSHTYMGPVTLREALGNSLNIPAIQTIDFVTPARYLCTLHGLGFDMLDQTAEYYKDGLALGSGEVTLLAMVQAYGALAEHGMFRTLTPLAQSQEMRTPNRVYSDEAASLIGNILSDPYARRREFGSGSVLNLPVQTAVKTGTSTDYRDAWVLGYNAHYTVGVWMGNLDNQPMDGVTGSVGPALVLRAVFNTLGTHSTPRALYLSPKLVAQQICSGDAETLGNPNCFPRTEYFMPGTSLPTEKRLEKPAAFSIVRPSEGLHIAYDPRRPAQLQAFEFSAHKTNPNHQLVWRVNDALVDTTLEEKLLWPLTRGKFTLEVIEIDTHGQQVATGRVNYMVK